MPKSKIVGWIQKGTIRLGFNDLKFFSDDTAYWFPIHKYKKSIYQIYGKESKPIKISVEIKNAKK